MSFCGFGIEATRKMWSVWVECLVATTFYDSEQEHLCATFWNIKTLKHRKCQSEHEHRLKCVEWRFMQIEMVISETVVVV